MTRHKIILGYASLCLIWGTTWMAIRVLVHDVPPMWAAGVRMLIAAVVLGALVWLRNLPWPQTRREWLMAAVLSITMMALPFGLIFWSEQFVSSSLTAVFYATAPLFVSLFTPFLLKKSVPRSAVFAMLIALGAIAYLFNVSFRGDVKSTVGGLMILAAVVSSSFSAVIAKREMKHVDATVSTTVQLVLSGIVLVAVSLVAERGLPSDWNAKSISALLFLSVFGSAIAFTVWYSLVKHIAPYKLTTTNLIVPFIAIAEGALILQEMITAPMFVAAVIVMGSVGVVLRAEAEQALSLKSQAAD